MITAYGIRFRRLNYKGFQKGIMLGARESNNSQLRWDIAHRLSSWTNDRQSPDAKSLIHAAQNFFSRKSKIPNAAVNFFSTKSEAYKQALEICFEKRLYKSANRILSFSTEKNKITKIFKSISMGLPKKSNVKLEQETELILSSIWAESPRQDFKEILFQNINEILGVKDEAFASELESLLKIREYILSAEIFALHLPRLQTGSNWNVSPYFYSALMIMAKTHFIPVLCQEELNDLELRNSFFSYEHLSVAHLRPDYLIFSDKMSVLISSKLLKAEDNWSVSELHRLLNTAILADQFSGKKPKILKKKANFDEFHKQYINWKFRSLNDPKDHPDEGELETFIKQFVETHLGESRFKLKILNSKNYEKYESEVDALEKRIYEPERLTDLENFKKCVESPLGVALALFDQNKIVAIAFAAEPKNFPLEKRLRLDPYFNDPSTLYVLAVTVDKDYQSMGLGKLLKYLSSLIAFQKGALRIQGRNRDRLARSMLAINLSLGAIEQNYYAEDYIDLEEFRDAIYYSIPVSWEKQKLKLSRLDGSLGWPENMKANSYEKSLALLTQDQNLLQSSYMDLRNQFKLLLPTCFTNFEFYRSRQDIKEYLQISKSVKSDEFQICILDLPATNKEIKFIEDLSKKIDESSIDVLWLEPIEKRSLKKWPVELLRQIKKLCNKNQISLVYDETLSQCFRFNNDFYMASGLKDIAPDFALASMGGACFALMGTNFSTNKINEDKCDLYVLNLYLQSAIKTVEMKDEYISALEHFKTKLSNSLNKIENCTVEIENGIGWINGVLPASLSMYFNTELIEHRYSVCPGPEDVFSFLSENINGSQNEH